MPSPSAFAGRLLPHSLEAEAALLSCCLLDGAEVVARCIESQISPSSFYLREHGIIFERLLDLYQKEAPIDIAVLAEDLKTAQLFDAVGGYAFLMQVSSLIPTTAQAGLFVEKVREYALRRSAITTGISIVEDAFRFTGDVDSFLAETERRIHFLTTATTSPSIVNAWAYRRAGFGRAIKDEVPTVSLCDTPIFNRGNIGMITALQKSGKSAAAGAILAAIIGGEHARGDTLGFRANNKHGHGVLHIDTEQSPRDHEALIDTAKRRAEVEVLPPWFHSYGCKGVSAEQLRRALPKLLTELKRAHGGVYLVLLDGVADLVADPNDQLECNPVVTELEALTTAFDCSVVGVLHLNPSPANQPTKSRGHLGSQLERKCETDLRLVKDSDGITTMFTPSARHAPITAEHGPRFNWDTPVGMHLSLRGTNHDARDSAEREILHELAADCFAESSSKRMRYGELVELLKKTAECSKRLAQLKVQRMKKLGVITVVPPRLYELVA